MSTVIGLLNYGVSGNIFSVQKALERAGATVKTVKTKKDFKSFDKIVLPGVGSFRDAMDNLGDLKSELVDQIHERPTLGICLGMQILSKVGYEFGYHRGLGFIEGRVERFEGPDANNVHLKVPQNGWNQLKKTTRGWDETVLHTLADGVYMYFNHSYYVIPDNPDVVMATTTYGDCIFCSAVKSENVIGLQCHPERSGKQGLSVYRNFAGMIEHYM